MNHKSLARLLALLTTAAVAASLVFPVVGQERRPGPPQPRDRSEFTFLQEEGFPLNLDPEIVAAADAPVEEGDMVMGIVHNGEARAYPVNYMNGPTNEVVNDTLGGTHIAPSW